MISRITRAWIFGVTTGAGEYAPMPPVFGPWSPSRRRLWSWLVASAQHVRAVAHDDEARLLALEELLDHEARAGGAEALLGHHLVDRGVRLGHARRHHHALARGKAVGLDYDRRAALADEGLRLVGALEGAVQPRSGWRGAP